MCNCENRNLKNMEKYFVIDNSVSPFSTVLNVPVGSHINESTVRNCFVPGNFLFVDKNNNVEQAQIVRVIYNKPATIVFWSDDTKTVSKAVGDDEYNPELGLLYCMFKKLCGSGTARQVFNAWLPEYGKTVVTLKDARKKTRENT